MKKTLTVNLNNIVFHIDDDAYDLLQEYLSEIAVHFQPEDERKEIMNDIEARIAELFTEKLQRNKNVINLMDVNQIIDIMGKPSQYAEDAESTPPPSGDKKQSKSRRFYRDPENAMFGGIAAGLSAYIGWDVTIVRILLVILVFLGIGFIIPIYVVVWFVAPKAVTVSQRLEMQGEDVTIEAIKDEINNVKNYMGSDKFKQSASTIGERMLEILKVFFKVIFGFIGIVLGVVGVVLLAILFMLLFVSIFNPEAFSELAPDVFSSLNMLTSDKIIFFILSLILIVGCPIFLIIYWAMQLISGRRNSSYSINWVLLVLWLAGIFMFSGIGAKTFFQLKNVPGYPYGIHWTTDDTPTVEEVRNCDAFNSINVSGNFDVELQQDSVQMIVVSAPADLISDVKTEVENGILNIYSNGLLVNSRIKLIISSNIIEKICAQGACKVRTESPIALHDLKMELLGASSAEMNLNILNELTMEVAGASKLELKGSCNSFKAKSLGASKIEAEEFISKTTEIYSAGASKASVYASESIDAQAFGASKIECSGNPKVINKNDNLGSTIRIN